MTQITGGMIAYEDGKKSNTEYEPPKKARAELRFDVAEGGDADAAIADTAAKAQNIVTRMLAGVSPLPRQSEAAAAPPPVAAAAAPSAPRRAPGRPPKAPEPTAAPQTRTKADLEAEALATAAKPTEPVAAASVVEEAKPQADAASMDDFTVQPAEVTDADLNTAVQKKNASLKDPVKIRALIGTFNPDPAKQFTLREIPQAQRRTFLDKLDALS